MIHCLKSEINGSVVRFDQHLSESELDHLYEISKYHDLSHMVGSALIKNKVLQPQTELYNRLKKRSCLHYIGMKSQIMSFMKLSSSLRKDKSSLCHLKA